MRLFLDTSVLPAACGSAKGASREVFRLASAHGWVLIATPYIVEEVLHNLPLLPVNATSAWGHLRAALTVRDDVLTLDRAAVFPASKDRPVLFGGLAWSDVLLTLDKADFGRLLGGEFYGLPILTPGSFLGRERAAGRLRGP
jgi:hypothetical protein